MLLDVAVITNQARTLDTVFVPILKLLCAYSRLPLARAYLVDKKNPDLLVPTQYLYVENSGPFEEFIRKTENTAFASGIGLPGRVLQEKTEIWIEDVALDSKDKFSPNLGVHSAFGFPIMMNGNVVAVVEMYSDAIMKKNDEVLKTIVHLALQLSQVCEREEINLFMANLSHDLRSYLHGILSFSTLGYQKIEDAPREKLGFYFREIKNNGVAIMTMLDSLLDLSRLQGGKANRKEGKL